MISKERAMKIAANYMSSGYQGRPFATLATTGRAPVELRDAIERELKDPFWNATDRRELKSLARYVRVVAPLPMPFRWQWRENGWDTTSNPGCEQSANGAVAWHGAHGDDYVISVRRTVRGRWVIDSFGAGGCKSWYSLRFSSPDDALDWYGKKRGWAFCLAECRCGVPGMDCD